VIVLATALLAAMAGAALAYKPFHQVYDEPDYYLAEQQGKPPRATYLWTQAQGARYDEETVPDGSVTTFDTDLFGVRFRNRKEGFVVGSRCQEPPANADGTKD
jgi:hypothetical protein